MRKMTFVEQGLLGFENLMNYEMAVYDVQTPFYQLRCQDDPDVTFLAMDPGLLLDDYAFDIPDQDARALGLVSAEQAQVLVLLTVPENPLDMTANLRGPIIVNRESGWARQLVLDLPYAWRHPVFTEEQLPC